MIRVVDAKVVSSYRVWLCFSDGVEGEVDLEHFLFSDTRPIVMALRDPAVLARFSVQWDTVAWDNGFDPAPEFLYDRTHVSKGDSAR